MTVTRSDRIQQFRNGALIAEQLVDTDITVEAVVFDLATKARTALATNNTFLASVAARRTAIANGKATATTGTTATVGSLANAQTQVRSLWTVLVQIATALDDLNNTAEAITRQNTAVIKLLLGLDVNSPDLLTDTTGT